MARVGLQRLWIPGCWAICQWSRSKVWGRRAHPIPSEVQRGAGGSRTGQPVRAGDGLQEEEIGDGDWRCLSALQHGAGGWTPVGTILAGPASVACRSPDSVWETQISASTSRQTPCRAPSPRKSGRPLRLEPRTLDAADLPHPLAAPFAPIQVPVESQAQAQLRLCVSGAEPENKYITPSQVAARPGGGRALCCCLLSDLCPALSQS